MTEDYVKVIDISHWQDDPDEVYDIDWEKAKEQGIEAVIMKASEGNYFTDPDFELNWYYANASDMMTLPYHWISPKATGEANAHYFLGVLDEKEPEYGLSVDCEDGKGYDAQWVTAVTQKCLFTLPGNPLLYTANWFTRSWFLPWSGWKDYPLWVMTYPYDPATYDPISRTGEQFKDFDTFFEYLEGGTRFPTMPTDVNRDLIWEEDSWAGWQFSSKLDARKFGFERGSLDGSIFKRSFFESFGNPPPEPPPPEPTDPIVLADLNVVIDDQTWSGSVELEKV